MRIIRTIIILVILFIAAFLVYIYSGTYNIAATAPHSELANWVFNTAKTYSIKKHAEGITPPELNDETLVEEGFEHYDEMCSGCHGAPGSEPAESFNPAPPALSEKGGISGELSPAELFWVIKNGIKMTGMPESGSTHSDDEIWGIVAFVEKLPDMTPEQYEAMTKNNEHMEHEHTHDHRQAIETETSEGNGGENTDQNQARESYIHEDGTEHAH